MKLEINNEVIEFKVLPSKAGFASFTIDGQEFTYSLDDFEKDSFEIKNSNNGSFLINAFGENHEINKVSSQRKKELKIYAKPVTNKSAPITNNAKLAAAIMVAYKARLS